MTDNKRIELAPPPERPHLVIGTEDATVLQRLMSLLTWTFEKHELEGDAIYWTEGSWWVIKAWFKTDKVRDAVYDLLQASEKIDSIKDEEDEE